MSRASTKPRDRVIRAKVDEDFYLWFTNESRKRRVPYWRLLGVMRELYEKSRSVLPTAFDAPAR